MDFVALSRRVGRNDADGDPDPYETLAWLRSSTPITKVPGPGGTAWSWFVTSYQLARQCLTDPRLSFDPHHAATPQHAPGHTPYVLATDPPEHTRLRSLVGNVFSPGALERLRPAISRICEAAVAGIAGRGRADLLADFALPIPEAVTYELFGIPAAEQLPPGRATELSIIVAFCEQYAGGPATGELYSYMARVMEHKRSRRGDDLVSALLAALDRGDADYDTVLGMLYLLFSTGQLSTAPFVASATVRLLQHPASIPELLAEPRRWRDAVNDALRHDSAVQTSMPRFALDDLELGGERIAKGETVLISIAAANRDPDRFVDPNEFRIDRRRQSHLAFGTGIHFCVGAPLARLEGEIALDTLFRRLPGLRLDVPVDDLVWVLGPMLRCPRAVPVSFPPS